MLDAFPPPAGFRLVATEEVRAGEGTPVRILHPDPGLRMTFVPQAPLPGGWYQFELRFPPEGLVDVTARFSFAGGDVLWLRLPVIARNHFVAHLRLESALNDMTLIVTGSGRLMQPMHRFARVGLRGQLAAAARRGVDIFRRDGLRVVWSGLNYLWRLSRPGSIAVSRGSAAAPGEAPYDAWIRIFDEAPERDRARHAARLASLTRRPLISLLAVLRSAEPSMLERIARGVAQQIYPTWELVVAAPAQHHGEIAASFADRKVDGARLHIVNAGTDAAGDLNAALSVSRGEFVLPLCDGTLLRPHALVELAMAAEQVASADLIYADADVADAAGRRDWRFKPAWSPQWLEACDYIGNPALMRRETVRALGGWRSDLASPQHDLLLRLSRQADPHAIVHLAKLLAHDAEASPPVTHGVVRTTPEPAPRVSLIVPTRDGAEVLATCIRSIRSLTRYPDYEILIVDNGSVQDETKRLLAELGADPVIRIVPYPQPFNFSAINNVAARAATGAVIGLVNNDIEATHAEWLGEMVALAMRRETGCVGAMLTYPDGRIQHAGIVTGLGGVAGHGHRFAPADDPGYLGRLRAAHEVSAVTAACLVVRRDVFDAVGGLDETLTVAFNDVDFCLKMRAAGYRNLWTPFARLIHHESASRGRDLTPAKAKRFAAEYAAMQRRWGAALLHDPYYSPHLTYDREDCSPRLR